MSAHPASPPAPELSRPLIVERIGAGGLVEDMVASPTERQALAERFGLVALPQLQARLDIARDSGHRVTVQGTLTGRVVQACVITLEPVESTLTEPIEALYAPEGHDLGDEVFGFENGVIDLGELVAQTLALALDPYPRKPGVSLDDVLASTRGKKT